MNDSDKDQGAAMKKVYPAGTVYVGIWNRLYRTVHPHPEEWFTEQCSASHRLATLSEIDQFYAANPDLKRPVPEVGQDWECEKGQVVTLKEWAGCGHFEAVQDAGIAGSCWYPNGEPTNPYTAEKYGPLVRRVIIEEAEKVEAGEVQPGSRESDKPDGGGQSKPRPSPSTPRRPKCKPWTRYKGKLLAEFVEWLSDNDKFESWLGRLLALCEWYRRESKTLTAELDKVKAERETWADRIGVISKQAAENLERALKAEEKNSGWKILHEQDGVEKARMLKALMESKPRTIWQVIGKKIVEIHNWIGDGRGRA